MHRRHAAGTSRCPTVPKRSLRKVRAQSVGDVSADKPWLLSSSTKITVAKTETELEEVPRVAESRVGETGRRSRGLTATGYRDGLAGVAVQ